jgi:tetratricopeptide (TPR) repeat protein
VARELQRARRVIVCAARRLDAYAVAFQLVSPLLACAMSLRQRLRVEYLMAMCFAALDEHAAALDHQGNVRELALRLGEVNVLADGEYLAGAIYQRQGRFAAAAEAYERALSALRQLEPTSALPADIPFELSVLNACAINRFLTGHYDIAASYVRAAERRLRAAPECTREAALVAWVTAQLQRLRGMPEAAYMQARRAQVLLDSLDDTGAQGRIRTVLADTCLDVVDRARDHRDTDRPGELFTQARPQAQQALTFANQIGDQGGAGLARLVLVRWSRLAALNEDRVAQIEVVLRQARVLADSALATQAFTALGDEFATQGETESAHDCYRRALRALGKGDAIAVGLRAKRALLKEQEWQPTSQLDAPGCDTPEPDAPDGRC